MKSLRKLTTSELRIGNYLIRTHSNNDTLIEVRAISEYEIKFFDHTNKLFLPTWFELDKKIKPIFVGPYWLEKLGFDKRLINHSFWEYFIYCTPPNYKKDHEYKLKYYDCEHERRICFSPILSGVDHVFPCEFIHDLQNMYRTIKGKELRMVK